MKKTFVLLTQLLFGFCLVFADVSNSNDGRQSLGLSQIQAPRPHLIDVAEPVTMYTILTATIDFTFDATYYSEYTIHLVSDY